MNPPIPEAITETLRTESRLERLERQSLGNKSLVVLIITCVISVANTILQFFGG
jgi:hypothetical protein